MATYSTLTEARAAYLANADYADNGGDATKAAAFIVACRSMIALLPTDSRSGSVGAAFDVRLIRDELRQAEAVLASISTASGYGAVRGLDLSEFR